MNNLVIALPLIAAVGACGPESGGSGSSANDIRVVGSSTVYPFTTAVAEDFMRVTPGTRVTVESPGTGAGMKLFCAGVGSKYPDVENASRQIKRSEYEDCAKN